MPALCEKSLAVRLVRTPSTALTQTKTPPSKSHTSSVVWNLFDTFLEPRALESRYVLGPGQYHLAVAGGYVVDALGLISLRRTHPLPQVVLTRSKHGSDF